MVEELIGNEEVMLAIARASGNYVENSESETATVIDEEIVATDDNEDDDDDYRRYKEYMDSKAEEK